MEAHAGLWKCSWLPWLLLLSQVHVATSGDCKGQRTVLRSVPGFVSDGPGNYSVNGNCEWLIEAPNSNYRVLLRFLFMDTECSSDYLFVYDGDSYSDPLLASLSGSSLPPTLEAMSGKMLLHLFSDANYNLLGFNATYSFSLCPQGCSGHGTCQENGQCLCDSGWGGEGCQVPDCSTYCHHHHGTCNQETQRCVCFPGYVGEQCDLSLTDNQGSGTWYNVSSQDPDFSPRTAAAGAFLPQTNVFYMFGGLDLNSALQDMAIYNFTSNTWERKTYSPSPSARHSHVVVEWNGTLILFGGELPGGKLTDDTWVFLPLEERWMNLTGYSLMKPPPLANHAAATVDNWLYLFGGRTIQDIFSPEMYRFNLHSWEWEQVHPSGGKPPAAAGHSMVFHASSRTLVVYGGHRPSTARFSIRVNTTDLFHVDLNYWTTLKPRDGNRGGPRERAFHSATVIGNYMVIYGGNLHIHYQEEKCYDEEIFFYHLGCHQWVPSDILRPPSHQGHQSLGSGRYSHVAALMKGGVLLVAGGYSGTPRGDLLAYKVPVPGSVYQPPVQDYHLDYCSKYTDETMTRTLGVCFCSPGYAGDDCSVYLDSGKIVWESLMDPQLTADTESRFLHRFGHSMLEGPDNTLWMFGGLSLRDGVLGSVYRYSVSERRWTQMLAGTEGGGPGPSPRYFHAAAYNSIRNAMYVLGGLTSYGAYSDFWVLNLTTLQWRRESDPLLPSVAGHTLTSRRGSSLILIGGYSPENGFNNRVLEYNIELEFWKVGHHTGTPPTGLYGHSTVYHEATDAFYVFGGHRFHVEAVTPSPELYSLYYPNLTWSLLAPSQGRKPLSHFFHVAALLKDTMVIVGGRTEQQEYSNEILFYQIRCNSWIRPNRTDVVLGVPVNESIGHAVAVVGSRLYLSGGFNGVALGRMVTLSVPSDPCMLFSTPSSCNQSAASCVWCQNSCTSADIAERRGCPQAFSSCFPLPRSADDCRRLKTCSECLAQHPRSMSTQLTMGAPPCKWCTNCPQGACIGSDRSCTSENDCRINQREIFLASNCSEISCEASDCSKCIASGKCMWTRQFKHTGETRRVLSVRPTYDWACFSHSLLNIIPMPVESSPPLPCPTPCYSHSTCNECLSSKGADGGWQQCMWSVALKQCMSPTFLPMRCAAGACGRVLSGAESCSPSCSQHTHCAACIQHPRCGWCARKEGNVDGRCIEGGPSGPTQGMGEQCSSRESDWAFMSCPPENECLNQHHGCTLHTRKQNE